MPTGYTAGILEGEINTFPKFAKLCMRAFGATIHMRDESLSTEYTPREPSDYHKKNIDSCNQDIERYSAMSDEELITEHTKKLIESRDYYLDRINKIKSDFDKLNKILNQAKEYVPPTDEHEGFKEFMIEQLESTVHQDCDIEYSNREYVRVLRELENINAAELRKSKLDNAKESLLYHAKELDKEVEGCKKSNKWVNDLLESVK